MFTRWYVLLHAGSAEPNAEEVSVASREPREALARRGLVSAALDAAWRSPDQEWAGLAFEKAALGPSPGTPLSPDQPPHPLHSTQALTKSQNCPKKSGTKKLAKLRLAKVGFANGVVWCVVMCCCVGGVLKIFVGAFKIWALPLRQNPLLAPPDPPPPAGPPPVAATFEPKRGVLGSYKTTHT